MEIPRDIERHLQGERVAWLTTVTDEGAPFPTPVWFIPVDRAIVVYSARQARRIHNIDQRPLVAFHFNSDPHGQDIAVVRARATIEHGTTPSSDTPYVDKYQDAIPALGMTLDEFDRAFSTRITLTPIGSWLGP